MCNTLEQDVKDFVAKKVANGESFTAFDVTQELGAAKHRYVKPIVHALFDNGEMTNYKREIDYSIDGQPFRYSVVTPVAQAVPATTDPTDAADYCVACGGKCIYDKPVDARGKLKVAAPVVTSAPAVVPTNTTADDANSNEGGTRLRIRKGTLEKAGFNLGSQVYVTSLGNKIVLSTSKPTTNSGNVITAEVDVRQNVRVNLTKLGIVGSQFKAVPDNGVIIVEVN